MNKILLAILSFIFISPTNLCNAKDNYPSIPVCFEINANSQLVARSLYGGGTFLVIPAGGNDNQTEYFAHITIKSGDTIKTSGGQSQQYVEILEITKKDIRVMNWGWAKEFGEYKKELVIAIGCEQLNNN